MTALPAAATPVAVDWLSDSEMAARVRGFDWSTTSLGPIEQWSHSLRSAVATCLHSRHQMAIYWGPELNCLYNDAESEILGRLHPVALGAPARELLSDSWSVVGPQLRSVIEHGEATWSQDTPLQFDRRGRVEVGYFTYGYSPIFDDDGTIGGVLLITEETTARVLSERRMDTLARVATRSLDARSMRKACAAATRGVAQHPDVPFALVYLLKDGDQRAYLAACSRPRATPARDVDLTDRGPARALTAASFHAAADVWPTGVLVDAQRFRGALAEPADVPSQAFVAALRRGSSETILGFLVAGISDVTQFDASYRRFFELLALGVARSVAAARAREGEREQARSLAALDAAKTTLFANASHELRTPLTLVTGPLEQALTDPAMPAAARAEISIAHRSATRMLKLVDDLLDFSRIQAGDQPGKFHPTDLARVTADIVAMFQSAAQHAGIELTVDCRQLAEPVYVDSEAWEKIVGNLLSNALKFTPAGQIHVSLRQRAAQCVLTVRDTGIGIPAAEREMVFTRLHRVGDPRVSAREGTGIGLALTRELVRLHGGCIEAQQPDGRGTAMVVSIPLGAGHLSNALVSDDPVQRTSGQAASSMLESGDWLDTSSHKAGDGAGSTATATGRDTIRVLIAEDNLDLRDYLRRLLAPHCVVQTAADGQEALRLAVSDPPSIVITDVMMPGVDGLQLLGALRRDDRTREIPVMLVSARADPETRQKGLDLGADDYVVKPFGARELLARVQALARRSEMRSTLAEARGAAQERSRLEGEMQSLLDDLKAAQRRVAAASDAERRHIERNLHDGAQQRLTAIQLELTVLSETLNGDHAAVSPALDRIRSELDEALAELRELAHGLYPPLLASDGLRAALTAAARRTPRPVVVQADSVGRLPHSVEAAVYFCCLEALQNVLKHAGEGTRVSISLGIRDGVLEFRVQDDGVGFDTSSSTPGHGLTNLNDRVAALGGRATVISRPGGGTTVIGLLPLR